MARITVFALMLLNGLTIPVRDLFSLQRKPALLIRSVGAVIVLVPAVVLVLLSSIDLPMEVATGLALLVGGAPLRQRASLATACIARNLGLAVIIATADGILAKLLPTLMAYMLLGMLVALPYAFWVRRRL